MLRIENTKVIGLVIVLVGLLSCCNVGPKLQVDSVEECDEGKSVGLVCCPKASGDPVEVQVCTDGLRVGNNNSVLIIWVAVRLLDVLESHVVSLDVRKRI